MYTQSRPPEERPEPLIEVEIECSLMVIRETSIVFSGGSPGYALS